MAIFIKYSLSRMRLFSQKPDLKVQSLLLFFGMDMPTTHLSATPPCWSPCYISPKLVSTFVNRLAASVTLKLIP